MKEKVVRSPNKPVTDKSIPTRAMVTARAPAMRRGRRDPRRSDMIPTNGEAKLKAAPNPTSMPELNAAYLGEEERRKKKEI